MVDAEEYYLRQMNTVGLQDTGDDETDRVYDPNDSDVTFQSDPTAVLNSSASSSTAGGGNETTC